MKFKNYIYFMLGFQENVQKNIPIIRKIIRITDKEQEVPLDNISADDAVSARKGAIIVINKIVLLITWFMVIASSISFIAIIIFGIIGKEAPSILSQLLLVIIGYLGGVIASYVRLVVPEKKE